MITDYEAAFVAPVVFALVGIFGAWIYYTARSSWHGTALGPGRLYRCSACGHVYEEARDVPTSRCPRCDRLNDAVRR